MSVKRNSLQNDAHHGRVSTAFDPIEKDDHETHRVADKHEAKDDRKTVHVETEGTRDDDLLLGTMKNDHLSGKGGNDALAGYAGNDHLDGGAGRDFIIGGAGINKLKGGSESDTFVFRSGMGIDKISDFSANDKLDLRDFGFVSHDAARGEFAQVGKNAELDLGNGQKLVLEGVKLADISSSQLITSYTETGPSSSQSPYLVPLDTKPATEKIDSTISFTSVLTTGDTVGVKEDGSTPWKMAGTPDGLGAFDNGDGTFTVLMNHEFGTTAGAVRDHGSAGSFISQLIVDKTSLDVLDAKDLIEDVHLYDASTGAYVDATTAFNRFCSADLAKPSAFYNVESGLGYDGGRLFLNGEESGTEGRAFAHFASGLEVGNSFELPWLGKLAHENVVADPFSGDKTVVATTDDGQNGQVYFYIGDKQATGSDLQKAGLVGGSLFGVKVAEMVDEAAAASPLGEDEASAFTMVNLGDVSATSGSDLDAQSEALGITTFLRPEDGAWDTMHPNRFYFVTTDAFDKPSRLWALDFDNAKDPAAGGTIRLMLDGTEGQQMMDNITVNAQGHVIIQEDVGNNARLGKIWEYDPSADTMTMIAQHDPDRFLTGASDFLTQDEESSGVIDVTDILGSAGQNAYLLDVQAHYAIGGELVEGGQLLVMHQDLV